MSTIPIRTLSGIALLQLSLAGSAQQLPLNYDSLPLAKPKLSQPIYTFPSPGIGTADLIRKRPRVTPLRPPRKKFDGLFIPATGLSPDSLSLSNYLGIDEVRLSDPTKNWRVHVYRRGKKTREKQEVIPGAKTLLKTTYEYMDMTKSAQGLLVEQSDTVGVFLTIRDPASDKLLSNWLSYLEPRYKIPDAARGDGRAYFAQYKDYALHGKLRDKPFYVVVSGQRWVSVILFGEKPVALFRSDFNNVPSLTPGGFDPYLLIDKSLNEAEREQVMMLSMVTWLMTWNMMKSQYP